eukprot:6303201-Pyramimonas_sp.AAC.1
MQREGTGTRARNCVAIHERLPPADELPCPPPCSGCTDLHRLPRSPEAERKVLRTLLFRGAGGRGLPQAARARPARLAVQGLALEVQASPGCTNLNTSKHVD